MIPVHLWTSNSKPQHSVLKMNKRWIISHRQVVPLLVAWQPHGKKANFLKCQPICLKGI